MEFKVEELEGVRSGRIGELDLEVGQGDLLALELDQEDGLAAGLVLDHPAPGYARGGRSTSKGHGNVPATSRSLKRGSADP